MTASSPRRSAFALAAGWLGREVDPQRVQHTRVDEASPVATANTVLENEEHGVGVHGLGDVTDLAEGVRSVAQELVPCSGGALEFPQDEASPPTRTGLMEPGRLRRT